MTSAMGEKTSVTTNSPFQDFFHPYDQLQSRFPLSLEPLPNLFIQLRALEVNLFDPAFLSSVIRLYPFAQSSRSINSHFAAAGSARAFPCALGVKQRFFFLDLIQNYLLAQSRVAPQ